MSKKSENTEAELEKAKERLRDSLGRLENIVDKKLLDAKKNIPEDSSETVQKFIEVKAELEEKIKENGHLREENQELQTKIGHAEEKSLSLMETNGKVASRVDNIIKELEGAVG